MNYLLLNLKIVETFPNLKIPNQSCAGIDGWIQRKWIVSNFWRHSNSSILVSRRQLRRKLVICSSTCSKLYIAGRHFPPNLPLISLFQKFVSLNSHFNYLLDSHSPIWEFQSLFFWFAMKFLSRIFSEGFL